MKKCPEMVTKRQDSNRIVRYSASVVININEMMVKCDRHGPVLPILWLIRHTTNFILIDTIHQMVVFLNSDDYGGSHVRRGSMFITHSDIIVLHRWQT